MFRIDESLSEDVWFYGISFRRESDPQYIRRMIVSGKGRTKAEALERLLSNWKSGHSEPYAPAAGSLEELRLKLSVSEYRGPRTESVSEYRDFSVAAGPLGEKTGIMSGPE
jgi:hypothetical protein